MKNKKVDMFPSSSRLYRFQDKRRLSDIMEERTNQDRQLRKSLPSQSFAKIIPQSSRDINQELYRFPNNLGARVVCRQNTPLGSSNISPDGKRVAHASHVPVFFKKPPRQPDYIDDLLLPFKNLQLSQPVTIVTEHEGKELALPSFITRLDSKTKTFCVHNPSLIYALRAGDSGARVLVDQSAKLSSEAGLVNALAEGETNELRCVRDDSSFSVDDFPEDMLIFKYQRLSKERVIAIEKKIKNIAAIKIKDKTKIGTWEARGKYNFDLRGSGLTAVEQLSYAGHLVFKVFDQIIDSLSSKHHPVESPTSIYDFIPHELQKSNIGKTSVVDASHVLDTSRKTRLKLKINADDPLLQAAHQNKSLSEIQGPPCPHVGGVVTTCGSSKKKLAVIHILVSEVDATRIDS